MHIIGRFFAAIHAVVAFLFACAAIVLVITAIRLGATALGEGFEPQVALVVIEALGLLAAAVVALQIAQTIAEEEVIREAHVSGPTRVRRFLSRFMVVLVVALSIETVVLVFRLSQDAPEMLPYAASVGAAAALLLVAWGLFIRFNRSAEELEPEAMQAAKREDRKIEKSAKGEQKP